MMKDILETCTSPLNEILPKEDSNYSEDLSKYNRHMRSQRKKKVKKSYRRKSMDKYTPSEQEVQVVSVYLWRALFHLRLLNLCTSYKNLAEALDRYCDFPVREEHVKKAIRNIPALLSAPVLTMCLDGSGEGKKAIGKNKARIHVAILKAAGFRPQGLRIPARFIIQRENLLKIDLSKGVVSIEHWQEEESFNYVVRFAGQEILIKRCRLFAHAVPCIKKIIPEKMNVHDTEELFKEADKKREMYDGITDRYGDKLKKAITNIIWPINAVVEQAATKIVLKIPSSEEEARKLGFPNHKEALKELAPLEKELTLPESVLKDLRIRIDNETVTTTSLLSVSKRSEETILKHLYER